MRASSFGGLDFKGSQVLGHSVLRALSFGSVEFGGVKFIGHPVFGASSFEGVKFWGRQSLWVLSLGGVKFWGRQSWGVSIFWGRQGLRASSIRVVAACSCIIFDPKNVPILKTGISQISLFRGLDFTSKHRSGQTAEGVSRSYDGTR